MLYYNFFLSLIVRLFNISTLLLCIIFQYVNYVIFSNKLVKSIFLINVNALYLVSDKKRGSISTGQKIIDVDSRF